MIFFILVMMLCLALFVFRAKKPFNTPGPPHLPILGATLEVTKNIDRLFAWQYDCFKKYACNSISGTWGLSMIGNQRMIFITDPACVKYMLHDKFNNFIKGPGIKETFFELFHEGIFGADGKSWTQRRKAASHLFSGKIMRDVMVPAFHSHADAVLETLGSHAESGAPLDVQKVFFAYTMDSICDIAFKKKMDSLNNPSQKFVVAFDGANTIAMQRVFTPGWKIMKSLNLGAERQMKDYATTIDSFLKNIVEERCTAHTTESKKHEYVDVMTTFIDQYRKKGENIDKQFLRDVVMTFLIAGRDTTGFSLTNIAYILTQHPEVEEKVLKELLDVLGPTTEVDFGNYKDLHYLHAFIYEILRMYPPVPHDLKYAVKPDELPDGTCLFAGDLVSYPAYVQGRDPRIWEDPLKFQPERWIDETGKFEVKNQYEFVHFNAGRRLCLGKDMSTLQIKIILSKILRKYRFVGDQKILPDQDPPFKDGATLKWKDGMTVTIKARN